MGRPKKDRDKGSKDGYQEQYAKFWIGVETEAPLTVTRRNQDTGLDDLLQGTDVLRELAGLFNENGLPAYDSAVDHEHDYSRWAITIDSSIEVGQELQGVGSPIEIKSPPMTVNSSRYQEKFHIMWSIIDRFKTPSIEYWKMASTHIHFSLNNMPQFPILVAQQLAFCVVYFDEAIDDLIPEMTDTTDRKRPGGWKHCDRYSKRNRVRPAYNDRQPLDDLRSCWEAIRSTNDIKELSCLMCYDDDNYRRAHGRELKNWKWNFKGLDYRTIEFRQMPPSRSAQESIAWIDFTTEFVQAAGRVNKKKLDDAFKGKISFTEALGGGIRGVAEIAILSELERAVGCGIRIQELFDLVVGTSTGGIVALGVFEKNWSLVNAESTFKELVKTAFSKKWQLKVPVLNKISRKLLPVKYKTDGITSSLQSAFGEGYLFGQADGDSSGDTVKVAVVTCIEGQNQPTLIANYTRNPVAKVSDGRQVYDCLQRVRNQSADFLIWQAGRATSAAQTFFKPYKHDPTRMTYVDGAIVRNNPVRLACEEAKRIWKSGARPDIVVSLGTGIQVDGDGQIVDIRDKSLEKTIQLLPKKYSKVAKIVLDMVQATIDCNREWVDFKSLVRGQSDRNYHRMEIGINYMKPPSIDDVDRTNEMWSSSQQYLREPRWNFGPRDPYMLPEYENGIDHLRVIGRRLLATLFYLSDVLESEMPKGPFGTNLCCRLSPQSDGTLNILAQRPVFRLKEIDANGEFFPIQSELYCLGY
ncbi:acyl transferase/acyl hydrolase/lysophospholipase [Xylaria castorea]|nr:acyl transferase/acyl hydrolase/lysophospholipase [Xylaria castorea]